MPVIRPALIEDRDALWRVLEPVIRTGETYCLPRDMAREDMLLFWLAKTHEVFVAEEDKHVVGTYFIRPNQMGGGSHVANCGYVTDGRAVGKGIAGAMCAHSIDIAKQRGYRAMQFNFVVSSNERAVRLWERFGFEMVGRLPGAFLHPVLGYVDALVMFKLL